MVPIVYKGRASCFVQVHAVQGVAMGAYEEGDWQQWVSSQFSSNYLHMLHRYWIKGSAHNKVSGKWFEWTPVESIVTACPPVVQLVDIHASEVTVDVQYKGSQVYIHEVCGHSPLLVVLGPGHNM